MMESQLILFRMRNISDTNVNKIKTLFFLSPPPQKKKNLCHLCENVEKYGRARQAT
jgi:hypothetical protein